MTATSVILKIRYKGRFFVLDSEILVYLDSQQAGKGFARQGIDLTLPTTVGSHFLEVRLLGGLRGKTYSLTFATPGTYEVTLDYSRFWGNFRNTLVVRHVACDGFAPASVPPQVGTRWKEEERPMIDFGCPQCKELLSVPSSLAGQTETCPSCGSVVPVPRPGQQDVGSLPGTTTTIAESEYFNREWNFGIRYPSDWDILWENRESGSWVMAVAVAGQRTDSGRPGLIVNVRRGEVLQGSSVVTVTHVDPEGRVRHEPKTPQEYIERSKDDLRQAFPDFAFVSGDVINLLGKPAARLIYSYASKSGRMQEQCVTLFCVGVTYQLTGETPARDFSRVQPIFDRIIASFRVGEPDSDPGPKMVAPDGAVAEISPVGFYNRGVASYRKAQYAEAETAFDQCFRTGEYRMQSSYAGALCRRELGREVHLPTELQGRADDIGPVYVASNLACHLIEERYVAALTKEGCTSEVTAEIDGSRYVFQISGLLGGFINWVTRIDGQKTISVPDPSANPNPTETDRFAISLVEKASSLPPSPLPEDGLPRILRVPSLPGQPRHEKTPSGLPAEGTVRTTQDGLAGAIGMETAGGVFTVLLSDKKPIPCERTEIFSTAADNQKDLSIRLYQGNGKLTSDPGMRKLGEYELYGIPSARRGRINIAVIFRVNSDGSLTVLAKDTRSGASISVRRK